MRCRSSESYPGNIYLAFQPSAQGPRRCPAALGLTEAMSRQQVQWRAIRIAISRTLPVRHNGLRLSGNPRSAYGGVHQVTGRG